MATLWIGINRDQEDWQAATSTSATTGREIELVVNVTNVTKRDDVIIALDAIRDEILTGVWPVV